MSKYNMTKWEMPLYEAVAGYAGSHPVVFHMPGHKMGRGFSLCDEVNSGGSGSVAGCVSSGVRSNSRNSCNGAAEIFGKAASIDVTEINGMDNLHAPDGVIKRAQELAAKAFGADRTFFLVNGSTCGIQAAIMSTCKRGNRLILGRESHRAAFSAMMLAGVKPYYVMPGRDGQKWDHSLLPVPVKPEEMGKALDACPGADAPAVLITSPNYYGICADIEEIAKLVHRHGKILIVDEAHGAHLKFHGALPRCAMDQGADISIQSAHKTLPALTQAAFMHIRGRDPDIMIPDALESVDSDIAFRLSLIETSSPSYLIMASLDYARAFMEYEGEKAIGRLLDMLAAFRKKIDSTGVYRILNGSFGNIRGNSSTGITVSGAGRSCTANCSGLISDPTRLVINVTGAGMTGFEAAGTLAARYNINVEMADHDNIICITTVADKQEDFDALAAALEDMGRENMKRRRGGILPDLTPVPRLPPLPPVVLDPEAVFASKCTFVSLSEAAGRICADLVIPYPPGVPVICPGERILPETVSYLYDIIKSGSEVIGLSCGKNIKILNIMIRVVSDG